MTTFNTQCILHWRLQLEEFIPTFLFTTGNSIVIADALSRIPTEIHPHSHTVVQQVLPNALPTAVQLLVNDQDLVQQLLADPDHHIPVNTDLLNNSILTTTPNLAEYLLEHPVSDVDGNIPFQFSTIKEYQQHDQTITNLETTQPEKYTPKNLGSDEIIILCHNEQQIVVLNEMFEKLVHWYHLSIVHKLGATRLHTTLKQHLFHPKLASKVC